MTDRYPKPETIEAAVQQACEPREDDWSDIAVDDIDLAPLVTKDPELVLATRVRTREMDRVQLEELLKETRP